MSKAAFLDLTENGLSVYSMSGNGKSWAAGDRFSVPVGEDFSFALGKGLPGIEESYLSLPLSLLNFRIIELPFSDMKKIRELLPFEIEGMILGKPEEYIFDACVLGNKNGNSEILIAYLSKRTLASILTAVKKSGFDPRVVTSLELACALKSRTPGGSFMDFLENSGPIDESDRLNAVTGEMAGAAINLRRGEFAYTVDAERMNRSLKMTGVLAALVLAVFLANSVVRVWSAKQEIRSIKDDIRRTYLAMFPGEKKITDEVYQTKAHVRELKDKESVFVGASPLPFLLDLSKRKGPDTAFTEITIGRDLIMLKGECPSLTDAQKIKASLEEFLTEVNISEAKPSARDRTFFTITAKGRKP